MSTSKPTVTTDDFDIHVEVENLNEKQAKFCIRAFLLADKVTEEQVRAAISIAKECGVGRGD